VNATKILKYKYAYAVFSKYCSAILVFIFKKNYVRRNTAKSGDLYFENSNHRNLFYENIN